MKNRYFGIFVGLTLLLGGCGKPEEVLHFRTRELTLEEIRASGYDRETEIPLGPEYSNLERQSGAEVINSLASIAKIITLKGDEEVEATLLAQGLPQGADVMSLLGGKTDSKVYEKKLESSIFSTDLVSITYKISYVYGASYKGKGRYLANVVFKPLKVRVDPAWSFKASTLSEPALNVGTAAKPVAQVSFSLKFSASGILSGSAAALDEFELNAESGNLKAEIRDLD